MALSLFFIVFVVITVFYFLTKNTFYSGRSFAIVVAGLIMFAIYAVMLQIPGINLNNSTSNTSAYDVLNGVQDNSQYNATENVNVPATATSYSGSIKLENVSINQTELRSAWQAYMKR